MSRIYFKLDYAASVFKMNGSFIVEFTPRIIEGKTWVQVVVWSHSLK